MLFCSTRSQQLVSFEDATISGTCPKGGLYVPDISVSGWPQLPLTGLCANTFDFRSAAKLVIKTFAENSRFDIDDAIDKAYAHFRVPNVVELRNIGTNYTILELFHGPTYAFKDMALQLLGALVGQWTEFANQKAMVITATSGDTGPAAISGLSQNENVNVVVLFPKDKVSAFQKLQMTTSGRKNVFPIEIDGDFDDCQSLVKACLNDAAFYPGRPIIAANSINIVRLLCQMIYYVWSSTVLRAAGHDRVSYSVPSGNFGNAFSCFMAKRCGASIDRIILGTNANDTLVKRVMENQHAFNKAQPTVAPAMDVSSPSNYERLVYFANRESTAESLRYASDPTHKNYSFDQPVFDSVRSEFLAFRCENESIIEFVNSLYLEHRYIVDPHTAIALMAADRAQSAGVQPPIISVATASPIKFLDFYHHTNISEKEILSVEPLPQILNKPIWVDLPNEPGLLKKYLLSIA